jgi:predicted dehydrogenase
LWDVGTYPVSFIRWIVGEPDHVFGWQTLSVDGVDKAFVGLLRYSSGALGAFDCGFQEPFRSTAEVAGTEGTLVIERPYPIAPESRLLLRRREQSTAEEIAVPKLDAYRCEVDALTAAVLDEAELAVPLGSSRANVATLQALYKAARRGQAQPILDA